MLTKMRNLANDESKGKGKEKEKRHAKPKDEMVSA